MQIASAGSASAFESGLGSGSASAFESGFESGAGSGFASGFASDSGSGFASGFASVSASGPATSKRTPAGEASGAASSGTWIPCWNRTKENRLLS